MFDFSYKVFTNVTIAVFIIANPFFYLLTSSFYRKKKVVSNGHA